MAQKTKKKISPLVWATWISAALCLGLVISLAVMIRNNTPSQSNKTPDPTVPMETEAPTEAPAPEGFVYPELNLPENPYSEEDFDYVDRYLTCTAGPCMLGVDVSSWQYDITWPLVKASGIDFAIIRLAWRGSTEGGIDEDSYARINYQGAKDAGLKVGGYFFSQAITPEEAEEEARFILEMAEEMEFDMPIIYDWEQSGGRTANMDPRTLTDCAKAFCQTIEEGGLEAMVYFNVQYACHEMYLEELTDYQFWLAMYNSRMDFPYRIDMWQHTDHGSVPGIEGPVDLNIYFLPQ